MVERKKQSNRVRHLIHVRKKSYYHNHKDWWPVVNQARGKIKNNEVTLPQESSKTRTTPSRLASIATNTTTSSYRAPIPQNTKTQSCRRVSASFAMGSSINTQTQDESKRPHQHITSRSKQNFTKSSIHQQQQQVASSKVLHRHSARIVISKPIVINWL